FFFSSRRRHTRSDRDWSSDVCSSDLVKALTTAGARVARGHGWRRVEGLHVQRADRQAGRADASPFRRPPGRDAHRSDAGGHGGRSEERRVGKEWRGWWWGGGVRRTEE